MHSSEDSDAEDDISGYFWNNWIVNNSGSCDTSNDEVRKVDTSKKTRPSIGFARKVQCSTLKNVKNWIPPVGLFQKSFLIKTGRDKETLPETETENEKSLDTKNETQSESEQKLTQTQVEIIWDWGSRHNFCDISDQEDGTVLWDIVDPSIFGSIKLWKNQYGHVCGCAEGEVGLDGAHEKTYIVINDKDNLRKLLNVSQSSWASLEESVLLSGRTLKFDAFQDSDVNRMSCLDKLWFMLCKRRHLLPAARIRARMSGAIKLKKVWKVVPKLVVTDLQPL